MKPSPPTRFNALLETPRGSRCAARIEEVRNRSLHEKEKGEPAAAEPKRSLESGAWKQPPSARGPPEKRWSTAAVKA